MTLQGAVGPRSLAIIQAEMTDSEGIMWPRLVLYVRFLPTRGRSTGSVFKTFDFLHFQIKQS